ncbi:MAG: hypothetical protein U1E20_09605 [Methylocystis sp.]|uniref:hypothetical protein n=1 Tax=Methylocystis sp. TaxID=1911079 RepID=UPI0039627280
MADSGAYPFVDGMREHTREVLCRGAPSRVMQMAADALQEWIVSPRVNRSDVGDSDSALIERAIVA